LANHLGAEMYWPIYEEAEKLNCTIAVHGGCHHQLGMDSFANFFPVRALGHPFSIMVQAAGILFHGVFERFPGLRVAFLEGGATWVPFSWIELIGRTKAFLLRIICKWICKGNCSRDPSRGRVPATIFAGISEKEEFTWALTVTMRA